MKDKSPRNKTLQLTEKQYQDFKQELLHINNQCSVDSVTNQVINGDLFEVVDFLPSNFVDLLILDPPYNLTKDFNGIKFGKRSNDEYMSYLETWFPKLLRLLKPHASIYLC